VLHGEATFVPARPVALLTHHHGYIGPDSVRDPITRYFRPRNASSSLSGFAFMLLNKRRTPFGWRANITKNLLNVEWDGASYKCGRPFCRLSRNESDVGPPLVGGPFPE